MKKATQGKKSSKKPVENVNSFLHKLWSLVNDESLSAIRWSQDGEKIIIDNPAKFTSKVLVNCEIKIFKTKNISSFIRQLNLYGFRRVKETTAKAPIIFKHDSFKRGRLDLLAQIKRKKPTLMPLMRPPTLHTPLSSNQKSTATNTISHHQYRPATQNYPNPYFNSTNLIRNNVIHMPFPSPFAVNPGPFFKLGTSSTSLAQNTNIDQATTVQGKKHQIIGKQEIIDKEHCYTKPVSSPYQWNYNAYQTAQEPGTSRQMPLYGNGVAFQAMMNNQSNYGNYSPLLVNNGIVPECTSYAGLPSYTTTPDPDNSAVTLIYPPQTESSHYPKATTVPKKLPKLENTQSCSSTSSEKYTLIQVPNNEPDNGNGLSEITCTLHREPFSCVPSKEAN